MLMPDGSHLLFASSNVLPVLEFTHTGTWNIENELTTFWRWKLKYGSCILSHYELQQLQASEQ